MAGFGGETGKQASRAALLAGRGLRVLSSGQYGRSGWCPIRHIRLIAAFEADPETRLVTLTHGRGRRGHARRRWLGGQRGVLLLQ